MQSKHSKPNILNEVASLIRSVAPLVPIREVIPKYQLLEKQLADIKFDLKRCPTFLTKVRTHYHHAKTAEEKRVIRSDVQSVLDVLNPITLAYQRFSTAQVIIINSVKTVIKHRNIILQNLEDMYGKHVLTIDALIFVNEASIKKHFSNSCLRKQKRMLIEYQNIANWRYDQKVFYQDSLINVFQELNRSLREDDWN